MSVSSPEEPSLSQRGFNQAIEGYRQALDVYMKGDARPVMEFFSRREDVTIANPILPARRGPEQVDEAVAAGAAQLRDGFMCGFEEVTRYSTPDLGYVVQIERSQARIPGNHDVSSFALRVTMIFRREGDTWRVVHRHADPITTPRPIATTVES